MDGSEEEGKKMLDEGKEGKGIAENERENKGMMGKGERKG